MARRVASSCVVALLVLASQIVVPPWSAGTAAAAGTPVCTFSQLSAELSGHSRDNSDLYRFVVLVNDGDRCVLQGRPALSMQGRGKQVGESGEYFPYSLIGKRPRVGSVTVTHRGKALVWLAVAVAGGSTCRKQHVDGFMLQLARQPSRVVRVPTRERELFVVCASSKAYGLAFSQILKGGGL